MKQFIQTHWRPVYAAYIFLMVSAILLVFPIAIENEIDKLLNDKELEFANGLTSHKFLFAIFDFSLLGIALSKLRNEDERSERIRDFVTKRTFYSAMVNAIALGFFIDFKNSMFIYVAYTILVFLLLFHLCLHFDPLFAYMSDDELKIYSKTKIMERMQTVLTVGISLATGIGVFLSMKYHNPAIYFGLLLGTANLIGIGANVYQCVKGRHD